MYFMNYIIQYLNDASDFFYDAYREVYSWVWPFYYLAYPLYSLCLVFNYLAWEFYDFNDLLEYWQDRIDDILSWDTIRNLISQWWPGLDDVIDWFWDRWYWFRTEVNNWWNSTSYIVQGWIDIAFNWAIDLLYQVEGGLANLLSQWNNFKSKIPAIDIILSWFIDPIGNVVSYVINWGALKASQISSLIDTAFTLRDSLWSGWQELRDQVIEFLSDPLEYLWSRFTDWFLGPEG